MDNPFDLQTSVPATANPFDAALSAPPSSHPRPPLPFQAAKPSIPRLDFSIHFSPDDIQTLVALAVDAGIILPDIPTDEALEQIDDACAPRKKKNGEVYMDFGRARQAFKYLILRSNGTRAKEAIFASGLADWMPVGALKSHNKGYNMLYRAAEERFFVAVHPVVVDSLVDAAVNGDTVRKIKDGEVVSEAHRANVRAQELVLKATDPRFREPDKGGGTSGAVTYNIGSVNVAQVASPAAALPIPPTTIPVAGGTEIEAKVGGFGAEAVPVRIGRCG